MSVNCQDKVFRELFEDLVLKSGTGRGEWAWEEKERRTDVTGGRDSREINAWKYAIHATPTQNAQRDSRMTGRLKWDRRVWTDGVERLVLCAVDDGEELS